MLTIATNAGAAAWHQLLQLMAVASMGNKGFYLRPTTSCAEHAAEVDLKNQRIARSQGFTHTRMLPAALSRYLAAHSSHSFQPYLQG